MMKKLIFYIALIIEIPLICQIYHPVKPVYRDDHIFDFGRSAFATLDIQIQSEVYQTVHITMSEDYILSSKANGAQGISYELKIKPGIEWYYIDLTKKNRQYPNTQELNQKREVTPFRWVQISSDSDITVVDITQQALYYDANWNDSYFECSDERLNKIFDLCKWTVLTNTFNGNFASSERERQLYEGDSYIHTLGWNTCFNDPIPVRITLEKLIYQATWPTDWVMHCVFIAYEDWKKTNDTAFYLKHKDDLLAKTLIGLEDFNLLITTENQTEEFLKSIHYKGRPGSQLRDMVDWPINMTDGFEFTKYNAVTNAYHYQALKYYNEIYRDTFDLDLRKERFNEYFLKDGIYVDGLESTHSSLHANVLALKFGLCPDETKNTVIQFIKSKGMECSPFFAFYLLDAMFANGEYEYAYNLLTSDSERSWLHMIEIGSTMTTEAWDIKYKPNACWNTAWSSSPAYLITKWIVPNPKLYGLEYLEYRNNGNK